MKSITFQILAALTLASHCALHADERPERAGRPNLLFILGDNWRWPTAGALGDPMARTPTFDRLAREGVLFTHTFNPVPSCSPTRACLLTRACNPSPYFVPLLEFPGCQACM